MTKWFVYHVPETKRWVAHKNMVSESFPTWKSAFSYAYLHACAERMGVS